MSALHELTTKAIRRAQAQGAVIDAVEDWDAIAALDRLARSATEVSPEDRLLFLDLPAVVGDVALYRLSWGASDWLTSLAMSWWELNPFLLNMAVVWAHAHARDPEAFRRCAREAAAAREIMTWCAACPEPVFVLLEACDSLIHKRSSDDGAKSSAAPVSNGPVLDHLMDEYKQPVDYFIWDLSEEALDKLIRSNTAKHERQDNAARILGDKAPDPNSRMARDTIRFQRAARAFVRSVCDRSRKVGHHADDDPQPEPKT